MLVALNIMRGVFGRFMRAIHGWYVRGGNKSGYAFGTDDSSQQFPSHHMLAAFPITQLGTTSCYQVRHVGQLEQLLQILFYKGHLQ